MRLLTFTNLYPNRVQPGHGIFVEQRLRRLVATGRVQATVVAPVPWFPSASARFAASARVPWRETRHGIEILHPRYPRTGAAAAPLLMALAAQGAIRRLVANGAVDLIDAHYYYPDGVAATIIGGLIGRPVVITARGSDLNVFADAPIARRWICWAQRRAAASITVSAALKRRLMALGAADDEVTVLRNGVDLQLFRPIDAGEARRRIGIDGPIMLAAGNLVELKGQQVAIRALSRLPSLKLVLAGEGVMRSRLQKLARRLGVAERVLFVGNVPQETLKLYYCAADCSVLLSASEGMPNVVLESMACGTPVIATRVGGVPEVITTSAAGILLDERTPDALVDAWRRLEIEGCDAGATRRHAEQFGWDEVVRAQLELFESLLLPLPARRSSARPA